MKTMATRVWEDLLISLHTAEPPDDEEWSEYSRQLLALIRQTIEDPQKGRRIVFTDGGSPNLRQRAEINKILSGRAMKVAIISSSPTAQGAVTALSWYNPLIRSFAPSKLSDAWQHLGITESAFHFIRRELHILRQAVGRVNALEAALATLEP
jgi:hypothetical protein